MFTLNFARHSLTAARVLVIAMACLTAGNSALAEGRSQSTKDVLRQAMLYQVQFRTGHTDIFPAYVVMLEEATAAETDNADLWYAMGVAYFAQAAATVMGGGQMADVAPTYQKGTAALGRALKINPDHPEAVALRAGTGLLMASFVKAPEMAAKLQRNAVAEMNRAIAIGPDSKRARLQRAFSGPTLPEELRNHTAEAEDLEWLMKSAGKSRAGDYIQLLRADLYFEQGEAKQARALYQKVETSSSPAAGDAKARLAALNQGGIAAADIKALRGAAGAQCGMCHGN